MSYMINNHTKIVIKSQKDFSETVLLDTEQGITGDIVAGLPVIDVIDDSLDSFVFKINDYPIRKPFTPFDLVEFTVAGEKTQYFVLTDNSSTYSQERRTYTHTIACVETTKYLEKVKIFNLTLTNKSDTLLDQFNKALINVEPLFYSGNNTARSRFTLSGTLQTFLTGKESRDFYFGPTDFRTVLDQMLSAHNARIIVENVSFDYVKMVYTITLGYHPINVAKDINPSWTLERNGQIIHEEAENDGQDYAGKIVSIGHNAIPENVLTIREVARSQEAQLTDTSAALFLPFPISSLGIKKFVVETIACFLKDNPDDETESDPYFCPVKIDLTAHVIPQEQYDLLSDGSVKDEGSGEYKTRYLPYQIGATTINLGKAYKKWTGFTKSTLKTIIGNSKPSRSGYKLRYVSSDYKNLIFSVTYYPVYNAVATIARTSTQRNVNQLLMGVMDSQTEKTLEVDLYGRKLSGLIKRTGNDAYCVDVKATHYENLLPLLSRITLPFTREENYVLYKREYAIYDNFIKCRYYFSQNYNAVQKNAGINRERHLYDIPLESEETPIVIKKYLHFSTEEKAGDGAFKPVFSYSALNTLVGLNKSVESEDGDITGRLQYLLFQSTNDRNSGETFPQSTETESESTLPYKGNAAARFILPVVGYALDKTMNFMAKPLDNFSVGYSRTGYIFSPWGDGGYRTLYNRYVSKKQNSIGEVRSFTLGYSFDFYDNIEAEENAVIASPIFKFPVVEEPTYSAMTNPIHLLYRKDRAQTPVFVLSVETTVAEEDENWIIVSPLFSRMNNLVRDNVSDPQSLGLYVSNMYTIDSEDEFLSEDYTASATKLSVTDLFTVEETENGAVLKYNKKGEDFIYSTSGVKSWCIADKSKRIYLAVNDLLQNIYACVSDNP